MSDLKSRITKYLSDHEISQITCPSHELLREAARALTDETRVREQICYAPCDKHMGLQFQMQVTAAAIPVRRVCPICEPPPSAQETKPDRRQQGIVDRSDEIEHQLSQKASAPPSVSMEGVPMGDPHPCDGIRPTTLDPTRSWAEQMNASAPKATTGFCSSDGSGDQSAGSSQNGRTDDGM